MLIVDGHGDCALMKVETLICDGFIYELILLIFFIFLKIIVDIYQSCTINLRQDAHFWDINYDIE